MKCLLEASEGKRLSAEAVFLARLHANLFINHKKQSSAEQYRFSHILTPVQAESWIRSGVLEHSSEKEGGRPERKENLIQTASTVSPQTPESKS